MRRGLETDPFEAMRNRLKVSLSVLKVVLQARSSQERKLSTLMGPLPRLWRSRRPRLESPQTQLPVLSAFADHVAAGWQCAGVAESYFSVGRPTRRSVREARRHLAQFRLIVLAVQPRADQDPKGSAAKCRHELIELCARMRVKPSLVGFTQSPQGGQRNTAVALIEPLRKPPLAEVPDSFRVLAIITAYNEADIIVSTVHRLLAQGIEVHVIDNWSSDASADLLRRKVPDPRLIIERFPDKPSPTYDWEQLLLRVEEIARASHADWIIHHDADEIREPPWRNVDLRSALYIVESNGFNAVDHTVLNFRPVDDGFNENHDPASYFQYCEFGDHPAHFVQIKAWKNGGPVSLADSAGHEAVFAGRRVFPYKFLMRHYPIRSQSHGERKILEERKARWNPEERLRGWHSHYDSVVTGHSFVYDPRNLLKFDEGFRQEYLVELLTGIGVVRAPDQA